MRTVLAIGLVAFLFSACAKDHLIDGRARYHDTTEQYRFALEHNLGRLPPSDVPLVLNDRVFAWMDYFQGAGRNHFQRYLERSGRYVKAMRDILRQNGLPQDLVYVALIESGFNNNAYSRAHAVGPWQFIRGTGSRYDLDIDRWVDERRDPLKATQAAAGYLKDLYDEFGDWYLAIAAYNAGEGRIRNAVAESGSRNFWEIADSNRRYLRPETRDYIPKFIAATIMAKLPANFGFKDVSYQKPLEFDRATVETQTDLEVIANCAGVAIDEVSDLNPHLVRGVTPPGARDYQINIPKGTIATFTAKYAEVPSNERVKIVYHKVRRGETAASIARRYGVSKSAVLAANDISAKRRLRTGTMLVIPRGSAATYVADNNGSDESQKEARAKKLISYRVKRGDTLSLIARKFNVSISQVKSWNSVTPKNPLRTGRIVKIYQPVYIAKAKGGMEKIAATELLDGEKHSIQAGESLWTIAKRYNMTVEELVALNGLEPGAKIKAGQKIMVRQKQGKTMLEAGPMPAVETPKEEEQVATEATPKIEVENMSVAEVSASQSSPDDIVLENKKDTKTDTISVTKKYKVKRGQSLAVIAKMNGVSVAELMKWNGIKNPRVVRAGQVLKVGTINSTPQATAPVPQKVDTPAAIPAPEKEEGAPLKLNELPLPVEQSSMNYKVQDGDTLWDIARRHRVTIAELQRWNNLSDPSAVKPGDNLTIHTK